MKRFVFLGNTFFGELPAREHAIAIELARRGSIVRYVDPMPSVAWMARSVLRRERIAGLRPGGRRKSPGSPRGLEILTPPPVPTYYRSSLTPALDRLLFRRWFTSAFAGWPWSDTVVMVMGAYWWNGFFGRQDCGDAFVVYDVCDALSTGSRSDGALRRMKAGHERGVSDADLVTFSANEMKPWLDRSCKGGKLLHLANAVERPDKTSGIRSRSRKERRVAFVGSVDERWVDGDLLCAVAGEIPDAELVICGNVRGRLFRRLSPYPNVRLSGRLGREELHATLERCSVGIIPFRKNAITNLVNPLKLYEYAVHGLSIVATKTNELVRYRSVVSLADDTEKFVLKVRNALDGPSLSHVRVMRQFGEANTWEKRVDELLRAVRERSGRRREQGPSRKQRSGKRGMQEPARVGRIMLLTDDMEIGGVPRHVVDLANGLVVRGVRVVVAASRGPMTKRLSSDVEFFDLSPTEMGLGKNGIRQFIGCVKNVRAFMKEHTVAIIHSHKRFSDLCARIIATLERIHHVSTCHNTFRDKRLFSVFGQHTIAVADTIRHDLIARFGKRAENATRIYNGISPVKRLSANEKRELRQSLGVDRAGIVIGCVANYEQRKDHRTLVEALARCRPLLEKKNVTVLFVGSGRGETDVRSAVMSARISRCVKFLPPETDVTGIFNICNFCVLPSRQEAMPYVILEAASVGAPHVASNVGAIGEFIGNDEAGLLVEPGNPVALADAITKLVTDRRIVRRLGANAAKKVHMDFGFERFLDETIGVYESVAGGRW